MRCGRQSRDQAGRPAVRTATGDWGNAAHFLAWPSLLRTPGPTSSLWRLSEAQGPVCTASPPRITRYCRLPLMLPSVTRQPATTPASLPLQDMWGWVGVGLM